MADEARIGGGEAGSRPGTPIARAANTALSLLAQYVRFTIRHRAIGCLAPVVAVLMIFAFRVGPLAPLFPQPKRESLAIVNMLETSPDGSVINEPSSATDAYFRAVGRFDAAGMMAVYHPSVRDDMLARGASVERLQQSLDDASGRGARLVEARRLANIPIQDGRRYVFYIVTRTGFSAAGASEELYFVFTLDPSGRVLSIT
ncbi:MAG: hypothetical protein EPO26_16145 [Chloroflexota bacterium]|nr:MAG: hypothetical protein EPO26_16145 [Chloroflexota bacterium]